MSLPPLPATLERALAAAPVAPVLTIDDPAQGGPLADVLWEAGIQVFEVTLRTAAGLAALERMAAAATGAAVGVGTVLNAEDLRRAKEAGASFAVAPGHTQALLTAAAEIELPLIPGVATPSEMMRARDAGALTQKFFPAEPFGGRNVLKSVAEPLADLRFWPTGGIDEDKIAAYLALGNVVAVGSSRVAPRQAIAKGDWDAIRAAAKRHLAAVPAA